MKPGPSILPFAAGVLLIALAAGMNPGLVRERGERQLTAVRPMENAPPVVVLTTVVLGGFRGLLADLLWLRVSSLQERGDYVELVQLAGWITALEPRSSEVWAFHAGNLAFNITGMMPDPEDRWRWVLRGVELLRDEGLACQAGDPDLYCELGWIYQFKIGGTMDWAHMYYRRKLAEQIEAVLPGGRFPPDSGGASTNAALISSPGGRQSLPAAREESVVRAIAEQLKLDPFVMAEIESLYGAMDWRLPEAHSLYWAFRGSRLPRGARWLRCDRMIYQSLAAMFHNGRMVQGHGEEGFILRPDPARFRAAAGAYENALLKYPDAKLADVYAAFLKKSVLSMRAADEEQAAAEVFALLREKFPSPETESGLEAFTTRRTE